VVDLRQDALDVDGVQGDKERGQDAVEGAGNGEGA
jgi:hypothetical protein